MAKEGPGLAACAARIGTLLQSATYRYLLGAVWTRPPCKLAALPHGCCGLAAVQTKLCGPWSKHLCSRGSVLKACTVCSSRDMTSNIRSPCPAAPGHLHVLQLAARACISEEGLLHTCLPLHFSDIYHGQATGYCISSSTSVKCSTALVGTPAHQQLDSLLCKTCRGGSTMCTASTPG